MGQIKVNGKIYETITGSDGIKRFKPSNLVNKIHIHYNIKASEIVKLVELDAISLMDLLDYYAAIGYSICGVEELSFFEEYEFEDITDLTNSEDEKQKIVDIIVQTHKTPLEQAEEILLLFSENSLLCDFKNYWKNSGHQNIDDAIKGFINKSKKLKK